MARLWFVPLTTLHISGRDMKEIDLNADLGEESPHEAELFAIVTSANISCGAHAGGGQFLREAIRTALAHDVAIGAHPSYPDRTNFGRISMLGSLSHDELVASIEEQLLEFCDVLNEEGGQLHHLKAHGALYNDALVHERAADAIVTALSNVEREVGLRQIPIMTMKGALAELVLQRGRQVIFEFFADRAFQSDGTLLPRNLDGAVLHDAQTISARTLRFVSEGVVTTHDGIDIKLAAESVCVHGDNPEALAIARSLRSDLLDAGFSVRAV